jgi:transcriptional regulator with XRE-family HTH domain
VKKGIGFRIKMARTESGLTQQELGKKLKTSHSVIATWESGKFLPNQESLKKLSEALNKPIAYFFEYDQDEETGTKSLRLVKEEAQAKHDSNSVRIAVLDKMPDTLPYFTNDDISGFIEFPRFMFPGAKFAALVSTDTYSPEVMEGDYCIVKPESTFLNSKVMLVKVGQEFGIYKVSKGKTAELYASDSKNNPSPTKEYKPIGEVVGTIKKIL